MNTYVARKIAAALAQSDGHPGKAQRLILRWAGEDDRLLKGLVLPYIKGIVAHTVKQAAPDGASSDVAQTSDARKTALTPDDFDAMVGALGRRVGKQTAEPKGMTALVTPPKRSSAGKRHEESLRAIAKAFISKRFGDVD